MKANRRQFLTVSGTAGIATLAGCSGTSDGSGSNETTITTAQQSEELVRMHTLTLEGAFNTLPYVYATSQNVWKKHGIDLSVEIAPFGQYQRQVVTNQSKIGGMSAPAAVSFPLKGEPLTWIGQEINFTNYMLTRKETKIEEPPDIKGKILGIPMKDSSTTAGYRAIMQDAFDLNILEDPAEVRAAAPPVVWNLLKKGELDAAIEFAGFSIKGQVDPDIQVIFNPIDYWKKEYGTLPPLTLQATTIPFLEENADLAQRYQAGWGDALELFRNNVDEVIQNFGRIAGLETKEQAQVVKERVDKGLQFGPVKYTEEVAESNWKFAQLMKEAGVFKELPDKDKTLTTTSELKDMVNQ